MANIGFEESINVEFKSDSRKLPDNEIVDAVVAFANTDGGDLYLGVEDDGTISGLHKEHEDITRLAAFIANKTVPPITVRCEIIYNNPQVLKISVPQRASIVASSSGKILRRRIKSDGRPENVPMYPYEITSRLSDLSLLDYSAQAVPGASIDDFDLVEKERLRNIIHTYHGEQNLLELSDQELYKALQLTTSVGEEAIPTLAGMLLIGKTVRLKELVPTAESSVQVLAGTKIKVNESFVLPLLAAFEKITGYFSAWNASEEIEIGLYRITVPDVDVRAFREALVNAFCHRDYSMLGRVRVELNEEGLTISNPGGFIDGIDVKNLLEAEPHGRNPVLADALKRLGLAERTGRGIDRIFEGSLQFGRLLPDYSGSTHRHVSLFIPKGLPDRAFIKMLSEEQKKMGRHLPIHSLLILNALKHLRRATVREIAAEVNLVETKVKGIVESLMESGLLEASGTGRGRYYMLGSKVYKESDETIGYIRQTGIDKLKYKELIMKLAKAQGQVTRANVVELLQVNTSQAYRLLAELTNEKELKLIGSGRYSKYIPL